MNEHYVGNEINYLFGVAIIMLFDTSYIKMATD